jgi:hypothetical protein
MQYAVAPEQVYSAHTDSVYKRTDPPSVYSKITGGGLTDSQLIRVTDGIYASDYESVSSSPLSLGSVRTFLASTPLAAGRLPIVLWLHLGPKDEHVVLYHHTDPVTHGIYFLNPWGRESNSLMLQQAKLVDPEKGLWYYDAKAAEQHVSEVFVPTTTTPLPQPAPGVPFFHLVAVLPKPARPVDLPDEG